MRDAARAATAVTENLYDLTDAAGDCLPAARFIGEAFRWLIMRPPVWPSRVYRLALSEANAAPQLQWLQGEVREGRAPRAIPVRHGCDQAKLLEVHGCQRAFQWSGMALDLADWHVPCRIVEGLRIRPVRERTAVHGWTEVAKAALFGGQADEDLFCRLADREDVRLLAGQVDGESVATSMLFAAGGTAGIYIVSTLEAFRRRGIGAAMTVAALEEATRMDLDLAVLQATAMGEPVYRALGFQEVCKVDVFRMDPGT